MIKVKQNLVSPSKYHIKSPSTMNAEYITFHNTANDAKASGEIAYMIGNNNMVSYHFAIDDKEVVQGLPTNRMALHCGDGLYGIGNRKSIGVEVCYSRSGGDKYAKAEALTIKFIAQLLHERKWGIDRVKPHQHWSGKNCPHRILDTKRWGAVLNAIERELKALNSGKASVIPVSAPVADKGYLIKGDTGIKVKNLQSLLKKAGYNVGVIDGIFGDDTVKAVKALQADNKIKVDGIAGNGTMLVLEALTKTLLTKDYYLLGDTGVKVGAIQRNLNRLGYKLTVDNVYGDDTKKAVISFQNKYKLEDDGVYGKASESMMTKVLLELDKPVVKPIPKPIPVSKPKEEEEEMQEYAVLVNSIRDHNAAEIIMKRYKAGLFQPDSIEGKVAKTLIVVGGYDASKIGDIKKHADKIINLSGKDRFETMANVKKFLTK